MRWMHLRLEAPLASFGGEAIDAGGVIRDFPAQSMLTGLFGNALGWTRTMRAEHQSLQDRIVFGAVHDHEPALRRMVDYQTAQLGKSDKAWSARGTPIGRAGGGQDLSGCASAMAGLSLRFALVGGDSPRSRERRAHLGSSRDSPSVSRSDPVHRAEAVLADGAGVPWLGEGQGRARGDPCRGTRGETKPSSLAALPRGGWSRLHNPRD